MFMRIAYQLVGLQALVTLLIAIGWTMGHDKAYGIAALLGGLSCVVPSFIFAWGLFFIARVSTAKRVALFFCLGGFLKLLVSSVLLILIIVMLSLALLPTLIGFVGAQFGFWLAPFVLSDFSRVSS